MKKALILLSIIGLFACKKKPEPTPEPVPTTTGSTQPDKKIYCIFYEDANHARKKLECGEMTSAEASAAYNKYRNDYPTLESGTRSSCSVCP